MTDHDDFPQILTREQVRFEIKFGLMQVGRSTAREWLGPDRVKAEKARDMMINAILARFDGLQVRGSAPAPNPMEHIGNKG